MEQFKISAKNLGATALEDFCPRCFWLKLHTKTLPWQSFPGIFASIDGYTKKCVHHIIDKSNGSPDFNPEWMKQMGEIVGYKQVPHWSKSTVLDKKSNIIISGVPDDILIKSDGQIVLPDFKTSRFTENQDKLMPLYEVQVITYSILIDFNASLYLIYFEPQTTITDSANGFIDGGFKMDFNAKVIPVENDKSKVRRALSMAREIFEMKTPPQSYPLCKDCHSLESVIELLKK